MFDFWCIGIHVALLDAPLRTEGLLSYAIQYREVIPELLLSGLYRSDGGADERCARGSWPSLWGIR